MMEASQLRETVFAFLRNAKEEGYDFSETDEQIAYDIHNADDDIPVNGCYTNLIQFVAQFKATL